MRETIERRRGALANRYAVWEPKTLSDFLRTQAREHPDRPFVITDDRTLRYADVDQAADDLAAGLIALGVAPGDRVGLLLANVLEFVPLKFAIARAGAVAIPFNFQYRTAELEQVLTQSRCNTLITMTGFLTLDYLAMLAEIDHPPDLRRIIALDTDGRGDTGLMSVAELAALGAANRPAAWPAVAPDALADILYTSGTTGDPKGVMVTHDAELRTGYASALTRAYEDGRRTLFALPCYHMFGYVEGVLAAMYVGGAVIPRMQFDPVDHFRAIESHRATDLLCVPTMTIALLENAERANYDISTLVALLSGAAPGPVWLWERVQADLGVTEITTGYGMTETGGAMTLTLPEDPPERHSGTVGRPKLAGAAGIDGDVCVYATADPLTGERLAAGTEGELISTGPTHMLGFWEQPAQTAAALRDGWVYSGDLGIVGDDGYLRVTGRSKELYKSGGELVMPKEVEAVICALPGVSQAYAVGVADERWGEIGFAWVVPEPGATVTSEELLAACRARLARFKVPKRIGLIAADELPKTPTGKVQKFQLAKRAAETLAAAREHPNDPSNHPEEIRAQC